MKFLLESFSLLAKEANWKMISLDLNGILFCCHKATHNEPSGALMTWKRWLAACWTLWDLNSRNLLRINLSSGVNSLHYTFSSYFPRNLLPLMFAVVKRRIIACKLSRNGSKRKGNGDCRKFNQIWITLRQMTPSLFQIDKLISGISCRQISRDRSSRNIHFGP